MLALMKSSKSRQWEDVADVDPALQMESLDGLKSEEKKAERGSVDCK